MDLQTFEKRFEDLLFASRWLMAPVYLGLVGALFVMLFIFARQAWYLLIKIHVSTMAEVIVGVLSLVDVVLIMNLIIIIILSGYENFVSKMENLQTHKDRPEWMGHIGFSDIKIKLFSSLVAITAIDILKSFLHIDKIEERILWWQIGLHIVFVTSSLMYAIMEHIKSKSKITP